MGMRTTIQISDAEGLVFLTEQYQSGLYTTVYKTDIMFTTIRVPFEQGMSADKTEGAYHKRIRKQAKKNNHKLIPELSTTL